MNSTTSRTKTKLLHLAAAPKAAQPLNRLELLARLLETGKHTAAFYGLTAREIVTELLTDPSIAVESMALDGAKITIQFGKERSA